MSNSKIGFLRWLNIAAFIGVVVVNALSFTTLIGGYSTSDVSDMYPSYLTPADYVFSIWSVIYFLVAVFLVYQALPSQKNSAFHRQIGPYFIITCICNSLWLVAWQYILLPLSDIIILVFLGAMIALYLRLDVGKAKVSLKEKLCVHLPFSVYFGWLTVAAVANVTVTLVSIGWDGFGMGAESWALIALSYVLMLNVAVIVTRRDIAYSLVVIWGLTGVAVNQTAHPIVFYAMLAGIAVILATLALTWAVHKLGKKST